MFKVLNCVPCAREYPVVMNATNRTEVPVGMREFPPLSTKWPLSNAAAVYADFFDDKSLRLGMDFRGYIFQNQSQVTRDNLSQYAQHFADENKVELPVALDPQGKYHDELLADVALGERLGVKQLPTVFVIGNSEKPTRFDGYVDGLTLEAAIRAMKIAVAIDSSSAGSHQSGEGAAATAKSEEHLEIHRATEALEKALGYMASQPHDFGGHKVDAMETCRHAIEQLQLAEKYDQH